MSDRKAEHLLADQGVFKGHEGLRGLAECNEFWSKQEYGTRLYWGDGVAAYLHRSVLRAAIRALDECADLKRQLEEMRDQIVKRNDRIAELERQLEETEGALYAEGRLRRTAEQQLSEAQKNAERMRGAIIEMHNDWQRGDFNLSTVAQCDLRSALEPGTAPKSEPGEADRK